MYMYIWILSHNYNRTCIHGMWDTGSEWCSFHQGLYSCSPPTKWSLCVIFPNTQKLDSHSKPNGEWYRGRMDVGGLSLSVSPFTMGCSLTRLPRMLQRGVSVGMAYKYTSLYSIVENALLILAYTVEWLNRLRRIPAWFRFKACLPWSLSAELALIFPAIRTPTRTVDSRRIGVGDVGTGLPASIADQNAARSDEVMRLTQVERLPTGDSNYEGKVVSSVVCGVLAL